MYFYWFRDRIRKAESDFFFLYWFRDSEKGSTCECEDGGEGEKEKKWEQMYLKSS